MTAVSAPIRPVSPVTTRAVAFVADHRADAEARGRDLADLIHDPASFALALDRALGSLADPGYRIGQQRVAPGIGTLHGVRWPLLAALGRGFGSASRQQRPATLLDLSSRLLRDGPLENHWFAFGLLERTVRDEPERTWQLLRAAATRAGDWITVDSLAHPVGRGILAEAYRWAELEQLVFSPSRWERRLVGSTIATIPHLDRTAGREPPVVERGLGLLGELIGDAEPDVRKALAWAYRTLAQVDPARTGAALRKEATLAAATADGHRGWVIRDALRKLSPEVAAELRSTLGSLRSHADAPSTSRAARAAAGFLGLGLETAPGDRPIIPRP